MKTSNDVLVVSGDMSGNITSQTMNLEQIYGFSIQAVWSGAPVGYFQIWFSNDIGTDQLGTGVVNWTPFSSKICISLTTTVQSFLFRGEAREKWARLTYTATSGSGTLDVRFNAKGV